MCGIAAVFGDTAPEASKATIATMLDRMRHRGPDGTGLHIIDGGAEDETGVLGHARLAIIDPAGGKQPILGPSNDVVQVGSGPPDRAPAHSGV